jgi:hypothetical protein
MERLRAVWSQIQRRFTVAPMFVTSYGSVMAAAALLFGFATEGTYEAIKGICWFGLSTASFAICLTACQKIAGKISFVKTSLDYNVVDVKNRIEASLQGGMTEADVEETLVRAGLAVDATDEIRRLASYRRKFFATTSLSAMFWFYVIATQAKTIIIAGTPVNRYVGVCTGVNIVFAFAKIWDLGGLKTHRELLERFFVIDTFKRNTQRVAAPERPIRHSK